MSNEQYPRVRHLIYLVQVEEPYLFDKGMQAEGAVENFKFTATANRATFFPTTHYADEGAARAALEPVLTAWELSFAIVQQRNVFRFEFYNCDVELEPLPPGQMRGQSMMIMGGRVTPTLSFGVFPESPQEFVADNLTKVLTQIYLSTRAHPDSILRDAYSFYTRIKYEYNDSIQEAAEDIRVSVGALEEINRFSTQRSAGPHTRKWAKSSNKMPPPLQPDEREWLDRAMRVLSRRSGEVAAGKTGLPLLQKNDI
jgi:hypothetical protein